MPSRSSAATQVSRLDELTRGFVHTSTSLTLPTAIM
jgi:hypothetical protein